MPLAPPKPKEEKVVEEKPRSRGPPSTSRWIADGRELDASRGEFLALDIEFMRATSGHRHSRANAEDRNNILMMISNRDYKT